MNTNRYLTAFFALALNATIALAGDLTSYHWKVTGLDQANNSWNNSDLVFTSQIAGTNGFQVTGYFDWYLSGQFRGRELFNGTLSTNRELRMQGYQLVNASGIILCRYQSQVTPEGTQIVNGSWELGIPGTWSAVAVPPLEIRRAQGSKVEVCWQAAPNTWYQLQYCQSLPVTTNSPWTPYFTNWVQGSGSKFCLDDPIPAGQSRRFYRLAVSLSNPNH